MAPSGTLAERNDLQPSLRGCDGEGHEHVRVTRSTGPAQNKKACWRLNQQAFSNPAAFCFPSCPHGGSIISTRDEFIIDCFLETEIRKAGVIIRTPAQWPAVFAI